MHRMEEEPEGSFELNISNENKSKSNIGQEQIQGLLFSDKLSWQSIIYDLINTEQLDPWDIDISLLARKYLEKIKEFEEANFFVSSKVMLAAALLLRIKSEILLNRDIPGLDAILFGNKEEKKSYVQERIELDEDVPGLVPRTPLPRFRKVTLPELIAALGKAIQTENRRIRRVVIEKKREFEAAISLPKSEFNVKDQIKLIYSRLKDIFSKHEDRYAFSELIKGSEDKKIEHFYPLLHLDTQHKVFLEQDGHLEEIWIWLKGMYEKKYSSEISAMRKEAQEFMEEAYEALEKEEKEEIKGESIDDDYNLAEEEKKKFSYDRESEEEE